MVEKTINEAQSALKKERFEFVLTTNNNIICQRYFRINGFRNESIGSIELVETIDKCVSLIDEDLKAKTEIYHFNAAPQVFDNKEQMDKWVENPTFNLSVPSFVVLRDSDDTYVWDGEKMDIYEKYFNKADFIGGSDTECILKFAFLDNGKEICSKVWDGNVYPRFVRTNIDLSNSRNKYENGDIFMPFESSIIKMFNNSQEDLIPIIVKEICNCCSNNKKDYFHTSDDYDTVVDGNVVDTKSYNFDIQNHNYKYFKSLEKAYKKKTDEYFKNL